MSLDLRGKASTIITSLMTEVRVKKNRDAESRSSAMNAMRTYVNQKKYEDARDQLVLVCSFDEKIQALDLLCKSAQSIQSNLNQILTSKKLGSPLDTKVAILCYGSQALGGDNLKRFVNEILVRQLTKQKVDELSQSEKIPKNMERLRPRTDFTLEELHLFAAKFQNETGEDYTWFFENFPVTRKAPPEKRIAYRSLSGSIPLKQTMEIRRETMTRELSVEEVATIHPVITEFKPDIYNELKIFIQTKLSNWQLPV